MLKSGILFLIFVSITGIDVLHAATPVAVLASGSQEGNPAENTLDNNFDTRWSIESNDGTQWIQYDFGSSVDIGAIQLAFFRGDERSTIFHIESSNDALNWVTQLDRSSSQNTLDLETFNFSEKVSVRYIRYVAFGNSADNNDWNSVTEIKFLDDLLEESPPAIPQLTEAPLWQQFKAAKDNNTEPTLPDFSYAGYNYSESEIPDVSNWPVFNVTDYGAIADDNDYDDVAIQLAINDASAAEKGVVFFPPGQFMISPNETVGENIFIKASNVVLKGSGAGDGGTEIFMDKMKVKNGEHIFTIKPESTSESTITTVAKSAARETFIVEVVDASQLNVGQRIIFRTDSVEFAHDYFLPLQIGDNWLRLLGTDPGASSQGFLLREIHSIAAIHGNVITLREPLHLSLTVHDTPIDVRSYPVIHDVGIEDILFKGNWTSFPQEFVHHKPEDGGDYGEYRLRDIHDYAWNAIRIDNLADGWIRNVEFKDWNQGIHIDGAVALSIENISFTGKRGHSTVGSRRSYGVLVKDSIDLAGSHHGPGSSYWGAGTVYLRYQMSEGQGVDLHSGTPYATLFDNVSNGNFENNGGPQESLPHHGKHLVAWNFTLKGGKSDYNFWNLDYRENNTFAMPFFVGLQGDTINMEPGTFGANELPGQQVDPESLFEAQLALRLASAPTYDDCGTLTHGESNSRVMFESATVEFGKICNSESQSQSCVDGTLSTWTGTYNHVSCLVDDEVVTPDPEQPDSDDNSTSDTNGGSLYWLNVIVVFAICCRRKNKLVIIGR